MLTERNVRDAIASVRKNFDANDLSTDADFGEAGLDSLDHASILLNLQESFGIEFPDDMSDLNSIQAIVDFSQRNA